MIKTVMLPNALEGTVAGSWQADCVLKLMVSEADCLLLVTCLKSAC